jgi:hypothetical protein
MYAGLIFSITVAAIVGAVVLWVLINALRTWPRDPVRRNDVVALEVQREYVAYHLGPRSHGMKHRYYTGIVLFCCRYFLILRSEEYYYWIWRSNIHSLALEANYSLSNLSDLEIGSRNEGMPLARPRSAYISR